MQPDTITRLRALWTKKPWTMPVGLTPHEPHPWWQYDCRILDPITNSRDAKLIEMIAERRLMDLLPSGNGIMHIRDAWAIENGPEGALHAAPDRLTALIAWAESEDCKE